MTSAAPAGDIRPRDVKSSNETREGPPFETDESEEKRDPVSSLELIKRTSRIFVRNLSYSVTEDDLQQFFGSFGLVEEVSFSSPLPLLVSFSGEDPLWTFSRLFS